MAWALGLFKTHSLRPFVSASRVGYAMKTAQQFPLRCARPHPYALGVDSGHTESQWIGEHRVGEQDPVSVLVIDSGNPIGAEVRL